MKFKELIEPLLSMVVPLIKEFVESKIIPALIRNTYEKFDDAANKMIEKLSDLVDKIQSTNDEQKRERHLKGFELGIKTLRVISEKLTQACDILENEVCDFKNGTEVDAKIYKDEILREDEIPF